MRAVASDGNVDMTNKVTATLLTGSLAVSGQALAADLMQAPSGNYASDASHTSLHWKIPHLGLSNYTARVNDVAIALTFDAENFANSSVTARIDPLSVDTGFQGEKDFDAEIASDPGILNASEFPTITFQSRTVELTGPTTAKVTGDLTLLGITRSITLNAALIGSTASHPFVKVPALGFSASATFDRTDFGLTFLSGSALGDVVEIEIQAELIKQ